MFLVGLSLAGAASAEDAMQSSTKTDCMHKAGMEKAAMKKADMMKACDAMK